MIKKISYEESIINFNLDDEVDYFELFSYLIYLRKSIEDYIQQNFFFGHSFEPVDVDDCAPEIVRLMSHSSKIAGVGPMASVAGSISELLARKTISLGCCSGAIDNGGDIALFGDREFKIKIYASKSNFSNKYAVNIPKIGRNKILGICTSSASVGHSISFGESDATTVIAESPAAADAFATALGNIANKDNIETVIEKAKKIREIKGVCIIAKDKMGLWNVKLSEI